MVVRLDVVSNGKRSNLGKGILDIVTSAGEVPNSVLLVLEVEADALPVLHCPQERLSCCTGKLDLFAGACIRQREALDITYSALGAGSFCDGGRSRSVSWRLR